MRRMNYQVETTNLHILFSKEKRWMVAHCLELDVLAQGKNEKEAVRNLLELVKVQLEFKLANNIRPIFESAPEKYWKLFHEIASINVAKQIIECPGEAINNLISNIEVAHAQAA